MNTGMKFFMDLVDVEYDQLLAAFNFYSGFKENNIVYPEQWSGSISATGCLNKILGDAVIVSGAGTPTSDGVYRFETLISGRPRYFNDAYYISPGIGFEPPWVLFDEDIGGFSYISYDQEYYPWEVGWESSNGMDPVPTFIPTNAGSFYQDGKAFFDGSITMFLSGQNFSLTEDSTLLISFERLQTGNQILLSSVTGNTFNTSQGYCLGVNDANKLYFKYWNSVEGPFTFTYSKILSDKNLITVNRTNSILTIGRYNNNDYEYDLEEFDIYQNNFKNNDFGHLYLGGHPGNVNWVKNANNLNGYIDKFYFFNNVPFNYINVLTSGLYAVATGYDGYYETYCFETGFSYYSGFSYTGQTGIFVSGFSSGITGVTGYVTGLSGYSYSGITGYSGKYLGTVFDNCGRSNDLYEQVPLSGRISGNNLIYRELTGTLFITGAIEIPLTGFISGSGLASVTGEICDTIFTLTGAAFYDIDKDYLSSLSYSEISLLSEIKNNDVVEIYYSPYKNETLEYNINTNFDNVNNNFYSPKYSITNKNILLFAQGQSLSESGYQLIPSGYETIRDANLDYFITGDEIEVNKNFDDSNQLFYDFYKNRPNYYVTEKFGYTTGATVLFAENAPNTGLLSSFIFRNGQKLLSGIDYRITPLLLVGGSFTGYSGYSSPLSTASNYLITLNNTTGSVYSTGNFNAFVRSCIIDNDKFLIGGDFTSYNGVPCNRIVRIFAENGAIDTSFSGSINNGFVTNLFKYKNKYLVLGTFTGVNNIPQNRITYLNLDGSIVTNFIPTGSGANGTINGCFTDTEDNIYIYGTFSSFNNTSVSRIAKLNSDGILQSNFNSGNTINNTINTACLTYDNNIIIGGNFGLINGSGDFRRIARMNLDGQIIDNFSGGFNSNVSIIVEDKNNNLHIGGTFTGYGASNPIQANRFIVLDKYNNISSLYNPESGFNSTINNLLIQNDGKILLGGSFTSYRNIPYNRFIRLNSDYTIDTTFLQSDNGFSSTVLDFISYDAISLNISGSGGNDIFMAKEYPLDFENFSGASGSFVMPKNYNNESSVIFYNGIRQQLDNNYIENSKFDLISGYFQEANYLKNTIYNNTNDFFV